MSKSILFSLPFLTLALLLGCGEYDGPGLKIASDVPECRNVSTADLQARCQAALAALNPTAPVATPTPGTTP